MKISPEQIQLRISRPTDAALLDPWGRVHRLEARTLVGRQIEAQGLAILEPSVSRHHAHLTFDNGVWTIRDLGSANGTFHDDKLVESPVAVHDKDRVRFGHIAFYIIEDANKLPVPRLTRTTTTTIKPPNVPLTQLTKQAEELAAAAAKPPTDAFEEEEHTNVGLPEMKFAMHEPTGGGGGLIEVDGKQVQLTTTQFELMALMIRRMASVSAAVIARHCIGYGNPSRLAGARGHPQDFRTCSTP